MPDLILHGRPVETVYDLLGRDENDMTYALGWGLTRSTALLRRFIEKVAPGAELREPVLVELQTHDAIDRGFTDIELLSPDIHAIVEAKRGWAPPWPAQLRRYEARFAAENRPVQRVVVLTQNGAEQVVRHLLGPWSPPEPATAQVVGWSDVVSLARSASREGPLSERRLTAELATYLRGVADMRDTESNRVYVVSLGLKPWPGWSADFPPIDVVTRHNLYFFPASGKNYPKVPPNYIAFRYGFPSRLQSIHHVDDSEIIENPHGHVPGAPDVPWGEPHFFLKLGRPIRPDHVVRIGPRVLRSSRVWADIDLLLTSDTITEALEKTLSRRQV